VHLPIDRRLPDSLGLTPGAPSEEDLRAGVLPDERWSEHVVAELAPDLLVLVDPMLRAVWTSGAVSHMLGIPRGEMLGSSVSDHVHPDDLAMALGALNEVQRSDGYHVATRLRVRRWDGSYLDTRVTATTVTDDAGIWMVLALRPVEDEVAVERRRAQLKALAQSVYVECAAVHWYELGDRVEAVLVALAGVLDAQTVELAEQRDGALWRVAGLARSDRRRFPNAEITLVADPAQLRMAPCVVSTVGEMPASDGDELGLPGSASEIVGDGSAPGDGVMVVELWLDREGAVRFTFDGYTDTWDDANADIVALMCSTLLATMQRCEQESELNARATRDPLTRLLNRSALRQHLAEKLASSDPEGPQVVLYADLNHFKEANDRFGHRVGDELLCRVADVLSAVVRPQDLVGRMGGDEFVVVFDGPDADVDELVERVRTKVDAALSDASGVSLAAGAVAAEPGEVLDDLLDRADKAMYLDKARRDRGDRSPSAIV